MAIKMLTPHLFVCSPLQQKRLASLRSQWQQALLQGLQKSRQHQARCMKKAGPKALYPYLCLLKDEEYVEIMLQVGHWPCGVSTILGELGKVLPHGRGPSALRSSLLSSSPDPGEPPAPG